jgi:hypothetical protein
MNTQTGNKSGFANNLPLQLGLLTIAFIVLIIIAAHYVW